MQSVVQSTEQKTPGFHHNMALRSEEPEKRSRKLIEIALILLALSGPATASFSNAGLFVLLLQTCSLALGFSIFMITFSTSRFIEGNFLTVIGYGYLVTGVIDTIHVIASSDTDLSGLGEIQDGIRLLARAVEVCTLLLAFSRIGKRTRTGTVSMAFLILTALTVTAVFLWKDFPFTGDSVTGAFGWKGESETIIIAAFLFSALILFLNRRRLDRPVFLLLFIAGLVSTASEVLFSFQLSRPGILMAAGLTLRAAHGLKLVSHFLVYKAIVETGIRKPYSTMSSDLRQELLERDQVREEMENVARFPEEDPGPVFRVSVPGDILYINRSARRMLEAMNRMPGQGFPEYLTRHCRDAVSYGERRTVEVPVGADVYLLDIVPVVDEMYVNVYARDITERVAAESQLKKSGARLRIASTAARLGIYEWDSVRNQFTWENRKMFEIFGVHPKAGAPDWDSFITAIIHPKDYEAFTRHIEESARQHSRVHITARIRRVHDGEIRWIEFTGMFHPDRSGVASILVGVAADITDRVLAEGKLQSNETRFRIAATVARLSVSEVDLNNQFLWSYTPCSLSGTELEVPRKTGEPVPEEIITRTRVFREQALVTRKAVHGELSFSSPEGPRWFDLTIEPQKNSEGSIRSFITAAYDITDRKRLEEDLVSMREAAEQANRAKSEFLASMSHELRTPISGILGMLELLRSRTRDREEREYLEFARRSANSLLSIIGEILDISRIEAGKEEIDLVECELTTELSRMAAMFELSAIERGLSLRLAVHEDVPQYVRTDWEKLAQILRNLVVNALKYTEEGEVVVSVRRSVSAGTSAVIEFSVRDTGIGIPREKLPFLFQNFSRVHSPAIQASSEGAGLGLAISRHLVEILGGTMLVESEPGKGSTFTFSLGMEVLPGKTELQPETRRKSEGFHPLNLLIAEDDRINQIFFSTTLEKEGHNVTVAANGREAVNAVRESIRTGSPFDLILMDIQMPLLNGIEATGEIRKLGETGRTIPIVALTAFALKGDRERFLSAGMDDYLTKPINMERLSELLIKLRRST